MTTVPGNFFNLDEVHLFGDRIVVELFDNDDQSAGGIYIGLKWDEGFRRGKVLKTGPGKVAKLGQTIPISVKPGDIVLFEPIAGRHFDTSRTERYRLINEDEILFVIEE
ncbi:MAG: co-chaperone GroES family protein [Candidatus Nitrosotenuis sp.]